MATRHPARLGVSIALAAAIGVLNPAAAANETAPAAPTATAAQRTARLPSYRLPAQGRRPATYDAKAEIQGYAQLVAASYAVALKDGQALKGAIDAFLANPTDDALTHARDLWIVARRSWEQTEAFRFYDGPIDVADIETGEPGPLDQLDGWPVDPAAIDQVEGNPTSGIVNDMKLALTRVTLLGRERAAQGRTVTTGWHAIEFLLWGEAPSSGGAGDRPSTDYLPGQPNNDRRRIYLKLASDLLVEKLRYLVDSWQPKAKDAYAGKFQLTPQYEALGRMLNGVARLAEDELAIKRLAGALDSKDPAKLTSRFAGTSWEDFLFSLRGIRNVWTGDSDGETQTGLGVLVQRIDPILAQRILHAIDRAESSIGALHTPLERETLPAPAGSPARQAAEGAIADLKQLASLIRDAGTKLGVAVYLPS